MEYCCFVCSEKFTDIPKIFNHLKTVHLFKDNKSDLKCVVSSPLGYEQCTRAYKTFDGLRAHIKKCKPKIVQTTLPHIAEDAMVQEEAIFTNDDLIISSDELDPLMDSCYIYQSCANSNSDSTETVEKTDESVPAYFPYENDLHTDQMNAFLQKFLNEINSMCLTNDKTDKIFELSIELIQNLKNLCEQLMKNGCGDTGDVLTLASSFTVQKLLLNGSVYKRSKNLRKSELYVQPVEKTIGTHWEMCKVKDTNETVPRLLPSKMHYMPIKLRIQSLFKQPEFRKMYFEYNSPSNHHVCELGRYQNFCCGSVYKASSFYMNNPTALQLQLSTDGFELCNPLGSKATIHNMTPIYFSIKNVPTEYSSKLSNIYLVSLCRSDDLKTEETDFNHLWELLVEELSDLEINGIQIDNKTNIKGTVAYLGYDNLGANTCSGFVESFGATNFCRFCTASKKETETMTVEDKSKLRTMDEYEKHLAIVSESTKVDFKETLGVKRKCELNQLQHFHILRNKSVDPMHDLNEGSIAKLLQVLFSYCISKQLFTEDWLIKKIQFHDFGYDRKNAPSAINLSKANLNQSATQLLCLFRNIGFILIDFKDNEILKRKWYVVESLQVIVQIAYSSDICDKDLDFMKKHIKIFLNGIY